MLLLCLALVLSTLAYGTVDAWSLALFQAGAACIALLWCMDAWRSRVLRVSRNGLQWPLVGLLVYGVVQLLPLAGGANDGGLASVRSLSIDPYTTRLMLVQLAALLIYFAAALAFTDSPRRLRLLVRTITIFGFLLAVFGLIQSYTAPLKIYWIRELPQSIPFGPFVNRHHFAAYMEMALALPLGLLFCGAVERDNRVLYIFAVVAMGIALIMTGSRGGIISLLALILFLVVMAGGQRSRSEDGVDEVERKKLRVRSAMMRAGIGLALVIALLVGAVWLGGESALSRFVGTVSAGDPTTGRSHFWSVALHIIRDHPLTGVGLGAFSLAYTRYDSGNGLLRVEQAHNDYLQTLTDAGIVGALLGAFFIITLFRQGLARRESNDVYRRGVAVGALAGCFSVLAHSLFDFTLHTTSNTLLFLVIAALATLNGNVENAPRSSGRRRRRSSSRAEGSTASVVRNETANSSSHNNVAASFPDSR